MGGTILVIDCSKGAVSQENSCFTPNNVGVLFWDPSAHLLEVVLSEGFLMNTRRMERLSDTAARKTRDRSDSVLLASLMNIIITN